MSIKEDSIRSFFWKLLERFGSQITFLIVQIVMARILLPDAFGMLAVMLVFINVSGCIVQSGLNTALIQAKTIDNKDYTTVFVLSFGIALVLYLALFLFAPIIADFYKMPQIIWPFRVVGLILLINAFNSVQVAKVTRDFELKKLFISTLTSALISGVAGIVFALVGFGVWALVFQQVIMQLFSSVILQVQINWKPGLRFSLKKAKELYSFGWKLMVSSLLDQAYQGMYDLIIGKNYSSTELGYFSQGKRFPQTIVSLFDGSLRTIALSTLSRVQDNKETVKNVSRIIMKSSMFVIAPTVVFLAVFASPLVSLLLTDKWAAAVPFIQIMSAGYILWPIHTSNIQAINAIGRSDIFLILQIIKVAFGIGLVLLVVFLGGDIYMIAMCTIVASIFAVFVNAFPNRKLISYYIHEQILDVLPSLLIAGASGLIASTMMLLGLLHVFSLLLGFLLMTVVYAGLSMLFNKGTLNLVVLSIRETFTKKERE